MANNPVYLAIISARAQKEITQAWEWYENRQQGLGDRFVKEVKARIRKIEQHRTDFLPGTNLTRKNLFPFSLFSSSIE